MPDYASIAAAANQPYDDAILQDTWGHLAPKKNVSYKCEILFSCSDFGNDPCIPIDFNFEHNLESSPWLYECVQDLISKFKLNQERKAGIYLFKGTFRNFRWYGNPKLIYELKPFSTL